MRMDSLNARLPTVRHRVSMNKHVRMAMGAAIILLVAASLIYSMRAQNDTPVLPPAPANLSLAEDSKSESEADLANRSPPESSSIPRQSARSALDLLNRATNARSTDAEMMRRANAGDLEAMFALRVLDMRCSSFLNADDAFHPRHGLARLKTEGAQRAAAEKALALMTAYCDLPYVAGDRRELMSEYEQRLKDAARAGDHMAQAALVFQGMSEAEIVDAYTQADDPWVIQMAMSALGRGGGPIAREIEAVVFPQSMRAFGQKEIRTIQSSAAEWVSCQAGRYCGPNDFEVLSRCYDKGNCPLGLDVMTRIQHWDLSGYQFELMQRYIAAVNARLPRGP